MRTVGEIYGQIDAWAPFGTQEGWDNAGLLVGSAGDPVQNAIVTLDITPGVLLSAQKTGASLIISHHPVIFHPMKSLPGDSIPYRLAAAGMAAICAHTNLDAAAGGVNDCLAERLSLGDVILLPPVTGPNYYKLIVFCPIDYTDRIYHALTSAGAGTLGNYSGCAFSVPGEGCFVPGAGANPFIGAAGRCERVPEQRLEMIVPPARREDVVAALRAVHPYEEPAYDLFEDHAVQMRRSMGRMGSVTSCMPADFARFVMTRLGCAGLRFAPGRGAVSRVAVVSGAGGDWLADAARAGADAFVTGEVKHHQWLMAAEMGVTLVEAGHYETEQVVVEPLASRLAASFPDVRFVPYAQAPALWMAGEANSTRGDAEEK